MKKTLKILEYLYNFAQRMLDIGILIIGVADVLDVKEKWRWWLIDKNNLIKKRTITDGFSNTTYTAYAQYWLIKRM